MKGITDLHQKFTTDSLKVEKKTIGEYNTIS